MLIYFGTEGYRSGHNEAVLKTVWVHAHVGSNPTPSAKNSPIRTDRAVFFVKRSGVGDEATWCEASTRDATATARGARLREEIGLLKNANIF